MNRVVLGTLLSGFVLLLPGQHVAETPRSAVADSVSIEVRTFQYRPQRVEVKAGTTVVWSNEDEIEHTAAAGSAGARDSLFDLPLAHKGARAAFTFNQPGTFAYFCARHPFMRGEIHVTLKGAIQ